MRCIIGEYPAVAGIKMSFMREVIMRWKLVILGAIGPFRFTI